MSSFYVLIDLLYPNQLSSPPCLPLNPGCRDLPAKRKFLAVSQIEAVLIYYLTRRAKNCFLSVTATSISAFVPVAEAAMFS